MSVIARRPSSSYNLKITPDSTRARPLSPHPPYEKAQGECGLILFQIDQGDVVHLTLGVKPQLNAGALSDQFRSDCSAALLVVANGRRDDVLDGVGLSV